ncbi:uncharacterized protein L969DRAFT_49385 [Mixia osmundae IAM 14324]|uniref:Uncharacterized protein n=1 Tax=Mixia osmundae (strain CBS 9802 / IAM 14324 / JCM 22182 / KY 12970) TaxID=764103 RepID=G7DVT5_MIXOS|nr:uncharacterized protein L969DRAFT_49385 [Mixia osmundae IAM 14324]KEI39624.1 hypothetical protein L969DRAFT_49385 [Mixia osmundae IAM 14324]GAA94695.1 hypothetical protein E5Q_01348 [Mixia osmundae IAM 14324]
MAKLVYAASGRTRLTLGRHHLCTLRRQITDVLTRESRRSCRLRPIGYRPQSRARALDTLLRSTSARACRDAIDALDR